MPVTIQPTTLKYKDQNGTWHQADCLKGEQGPQGPVGETGATGPTGATGATPAFTIGTVTDVPYGTGSSATITGTAAAPVLNLQLQHGQSGNETIDDTKGNGDTDFVWSASKTYNEVNGLKSAINNNYGDYQINFVRGSANTQTGALVPNSSITDRLISGITKKGLYKYVVKNDANIQYFVLYYSSGSTSDFVKAVGWKAETSYEIEDYPYIVVLLKNGSAGTAAFETTEAPVYLSEINVVPSAENLKNSINTLTGNVTQLSSSIENVDDVLTNTNEIADSLLYNKTNHINRASVAQSNSYANTRRWFLDITIPAKTYIQSFNFYENSVKSNTALTVELWALTDNTLTKVKSVVVDEFTSAFENVVLIDYYCESRTMVSFLCTESVGYVANASIHILNSSDTSTSTSTLLLSSLTDFGEYSPSVTVKTISAKFSENPAFSGNVITVGTGMDYEEIQDAIISIADDSASKPYTILVMPRGTPYQRFSTLRQFSQSYPWNNISPRYISIIGIDKKHCIIKSDSGNYKLPCGEPMLNGTIKNITFIMTNSDQDPEATQGGYCLHIDCRTKNDVGYNMLIEDCDFEDASGPCLGIGMHKNCTLTIRRCNFHTTLAANYSPHEGYTNLVNYGVVFCHSSTLSTATDQRISFEDCVGLCKEGNKGLWIATAGDYDPETASFYYRLIRNVFWNTTQAAPAYSISGTLTADPMNFGNNIPT